MNAEKFVNEENPSVTSFAANGQTYAALVVDMAAVTRASRHSRPAAAVFAAGLRSLAFAANKIADVLDARDGKEKP